MSLDIATRVEQDVVIVDVGKSLDFRNASAFKTKCQQHVEQGTRHVVIDFTRANILDSTALGALFSIYRQISPRDGQMVLVGARGTVAHVIELTKLDRVFEQYATVEEALAALS
jgi:anti-sigma B factor antagonist